jgi:predicted Zn finger-like uncharacterized protein
MSGNRWDESQDPERTHIEPPREVLRAECPTCGRQFRVSATVAGRAVRCPGCGHAIPVPAPAGGPRPASAGGPALALVLGIIALALGVPALTVGWLAAVRVVALVAAGVGLFAGTLGALVAAAHRGRGLALPLAGAGVSLLALGTAVLFALLPTGRSAPEAAGGAGGAPAAWGQPTDPDGDCTITRQANAVAISVPATPHDLTIEEGRVNAPRVLQEVDGDFTATVKVSGTFRPRPPGTVAGHLPFQSGGLLLWADDHNYVRLERAGLVDRTGAPQQYASVEVRAGGRPTGVTAPVPLQDQDTYLRLQRRGNEVLGSVSQDGQQWTPLQPVALALPQRLRVGVAVVNAAAQPLSVRFEDIQVGR